MDDRLRRKKQIFQKVKSLTLDHFWQWLNDQHTMGYAKAQEHYVTAMEIVLQPKQRKAVLQKADEIRALWDGIDVVTVDDTEGAQFKTADEIINNWSATEAFMYNLEEEAIVSVGDRKFRVTPL